MKRGLWKEGTREGGPDRGREHEKGQCSVEQSTTRPRDGVPGVSVETGDLDKPPRSSQVTGRVMEHVQTGRQSGRWVVVNGYVGRSLKEGT